MVLPLPHTEERWRVRNLPYAVYRGFIPDTPHALSCLFPRTSKLYFTTILHSNPGYSMSDWCQKQTLVTLGSTLCTLNNHPGHATRGIFNLRKRESLSRFTIDLRVHHQSWPPKLNVMFRPGPPSFPQLRRASGVELHSTGFRTLVEEFEFSNITSQYHNGLHGNGTLSQSKPFQPIPRLRPKFEHFLPAARYPR